MNDSFDDDLALKSKSERRLYAMERAREEVEREDTQFELDDRVERTGGRGSRGYDKAGKQDEFARRKLAYETMKLNKHLNPPPEQINNHQYALKFKKKPPVKYDISSTNISFSVRKKTDGSIHRFQGSLVERPVIAMFNCPQSMLPFLDGTEYQYNWTHGDKFVRVNVDGYKVYVPVKAVPKVNQINGQNGTKHGLCHVAIEVATLMGNFCFFDSGEYCPGCGQGLMKMARNPCVYICLYCGVHVPERYIPLAERLLRGAWIIVPDEDGDALEPDEVLHFYVKALVGCGYIFVKRSSLNGNNGEWTNGDDVAGFIKRNRGIAQVEFEDEDFSEVVSPISVDWNDVDGLLVPPDDYFREVEDPDLVFVTEHIVETLANVGQFLDLPADRVILHKPLEIEFSEMGFTFHGEVISEIESPFPLRNSAAVWRPIVGRSHWLRLFRDTVLVEMKHKRVVAMRSQINVDLSESTKAVARRKACPAAIWAPIKPPKAAKFELPLVPPPKPSKWGRLFPKREVKVVKTDLLADEVWLPIKSPKISMLGWAYDGIVSIRRRCIRFITMDPVSEFAGSKLPGDIRPENYAVRRVHRETDKRRRVHTSYLMAFGYTDEVKVKVYPRLADELFRKFAGSTIGPTTMNTLLSSVTYYASQEKGESDKVVLADTAAHTYIQIVLAQARNSQVDGKLAGSLAAYTF